MTTEKELQLLRLSLPAHYRKVVMSKLARKYSGQYIYLVLTGERTNPEVFNALVQVAKEHQATQKKLRKAIANL